jgi:predicted O-methyltransferase YrrM
MWMKKLKHFIATKAFIASTLIQHPELRRAFSITSHLTFPERHRLYKLALGKKNILEIGSYIGASAACFGAAAQKGNGSTIYCIDTWNNDAMTEGKKDTSALFSDNIAPYKKWIVPVRGFSTEVVDNVSNHTKELDVLFIDGDHSYEGAKGDWEAYKHFLKEGSVVIFHDIGWAEGVKKVVHEDVLPIVSDYGNLPNMWWGTLKKKP